MAKDIESIIGGFITIIIAIPLCIQIFKILLDSFVHVFNAFLGFILALAVVISIFMKLTKWER